MNVPPKILKHHAQERLNGKSLVPSSPEEPPEPDSEALSVVEPAAAGPAPVSAAQDLEQVSTPLPVLQAFQRFLDAERRRARSRMLALTALALFILVTVGGAGVFMGVMFMDRTRADINDIRRTMTNVEGDAIQLKSKTQITLARLSSEAESLRGEIARDKKERVSEITTQIGAQTKEIDNLTKLAAGMKAENEFLRAELRRLALCLPALSNDVTAVMLELSRLRSAAPAPTIAPAEAEQGKGKTAESIVFLMPVRPGKGSVAWRLPIPE